MHGAPSRATVKDIMPKHVDLPPNAGPARDARILKRVDDKLFDPIRWLLVQTSAAGPSGKTHTLDVCVMADALMMDGVRVNVSAMLAQQVADRLGAMLITPKLADLAYLARSMTVLPSPQPITATTAGMEAHSARVDAQVEVEGGAGDRTLVQTVGKHWGLINALAPHLDGSVACNYGWQFPPGEPSMVYGQDGKAEPWPNPARCVTPGLFCIQDVGTFHNASHVDYSQTCVLPMMDCVVDGKPHQRLADVVMDPELAPLVSHEGALKLWRQPGTPDVVLLASPPPDNACELAGGPVALGTLSDVLPWLGPVPTPIGTWANVYCLFCPMGTVFRHTIPVGAAMVPVVARVECHGPDSEIPFWHKGVSVYHPKKPSGGPMLVLPDAPAGWPHVG